MLPITKPFLFAALTMCSAALAASLLAGMASATLSDLDQTAGQALPGEQRPGSAKEQPSPAPPSMDPGFVQKPDSPPIPGAVVTPPVIDPEMAIDPHRGQPLDDAPAPQPIPAPPPVPGPDPTPEPPRPGPPPVP